MLPTRDSIAAPHETPIATTSTKQSQNREPRVIVQEPGSWVDGMGDQIQEMSASLDRLEALTAAIQAQQVAMARMQTLFIALQTGSTEDEAYQALRHEATDLVEDVLGEVPSKDEASDKTPTGLPLQLSDM